MWNIRSDIKCARFSQRPFSVHHIAVSLAKMSSNSILLLSKEVNLDKENNCYHIILFSYFMQLFIIQHLIIHEVG